MKDYSTSSLMDIIKFNNTLTKRDKNMTVAEIYGKERFCYFLYSLIKMEQPNTVLELGTGLGTCTFLMAQALKENNKGKIWTVDNGEEWNKKDHLDEVYETHKDFFDSFTKRFDLQNFIQLVSDFDVRKNIVFNPNKKIDLLFSDIIDADVLGCINILRGYLPLMSSRSSIFIDRASTINHTFLFLEKIINDIQMNKINGCLLNGLPEESKDLIYKLVEKSKFTLVHLVENNNNKKHKIQNSTAWIKIEPLDCVHQQGILNFME
tara:strand:- start:856 stop:1647 length:792 start_codon:yes stop_codon:yes gene_type:complete